MPKKKSKSGNSTAKRELKRLAKQNQLLRRRIELLLLERARRITRPNPDKTPWFELEAYFTGDEIHTVDLETKVHIMGLLGDVLVCQVPKGTRSSALDALSQQLANHGIESEVLYIQEDVEFFRLQPATPEDTQMLREKYHAMEQARDEDPDPDRETTTATFGSRPRDPGDGVGGDRHPDVDADRGGSDQDEERERAKEDGPAPDEGGSGS